MQKIVPDIPKIVARLDNRIVEARENGSFLERLSKETNMSTVSQELSMLTNLLHPASDTRQDFEVKLRATIFNIVNAAFTKAGTGAFAFDYAQSASMVPFDGGRNQAVPGAREMLHSLNFNIDRDEVEGINRVANISKFRDLLVYGGQGHFDGINQELIDKITKRGIEIGAQTCYFDHSLPENPRRYVPAMPFLPTCVPAPT